MSAPLALAFASCQAYLPEPFRSEHERLFHPEHLEKLADRLLNFFQNGVPDTFPPPTLEVECTPPLAGAFAPFRVFLEAWQRTPDANSPEVGRRLADTLTTAGTDNLLLLLGQRRTPGSLTDHRAIPRPREELLLASAAIFSGRLSVGARAWTKHLHRPDQPFWGELKGSDSEKNARAQEVIEEILRTATWWNVFEHYKHEVVFEARVSEGYGVRWGNDGQTFIGFLEPFTPGFPHVRD